MSDPGADLPASSWGDKDPLWLSPARIDANIIPNGTRISINPTPVHSKQMLVALVMRARRRTAERPYTKAPLFLATGNMSSTIAQANIISIIIMILILAYCERSMLICPVSFLLTMVGCEPTW